MDQFCISLLLLGGKGTKGGVISYTISFGFINTSQISMLQSVIVTMSFGPKMKIFNFLEF